jgi:hypothetical protein
MKLHQVGRDHWLRLYDRNRHVRTTKCQHAPGDERRTGRKGKDGEKKGRLHSHAAGLSFQAIGYGYWMTVSGAAKGCTGAAAVTFCQTAPAALVANDLLPVDAKLVGIAVA